MQLGIIHQQRTEQRLLRIKTFVITTDPLRYNGVWGTNLETDDI